jgi:hypothetical protein
MRHEPIGDRGRAPAVRGLQGRARRVGALDIIALGGGLVREVALLRGHPGQIDDTRPAARIAGSVSALGSLEPQHPLPPSDPRRDPVRLPARTRYRLRRGHVDATTAPADTEPTSFDLITAVASLHHIGAELALVHLRGLLRPGGVLAVIGLAHRRSTGHWTSPRSFPTARGDCAPSTGSTDRRSYGRRRRAMHRCGGSRRAFYPAPAANAGSTGATRSCGPSPDPL